MKAKPIFKDELSKIFELRNDELWRKSFVDVRGRYFAERKAIINFSQDGYARVYANKRWLKLHRVLYTLVHGDIPKDYCIDHINGNKKDNQLNNLRAVKTHENAQNQICHRNGKLIGGTFLKRSKKWQVYIERNKKRIYLGLFKTEQEAFLAYKNFDGNVP
jgi:hypothetical protein